MRSLQRIRTQIRVVSAFRDAATRQTLRRRAQMMAQYSLDAPPHSKSPHNKSPRSLSPPVTPQAQQTPRVSTLDHSAAIEPPHAARPASELWHQLVNRIRFQIRVTRAFQAGLGARMSLEHGPHTHYSYTPTNNRRRESDLPFQTTKAPIAEEIPLGESNQDIA